MLQPISHSTLLVKISRDLSRSLRGALSPASSVADPWRRLSALSACRVSTQSGRMVLSAHATPPPVQHHPPPVRRRPVLEHIDPLPGSQRQPPSITGIESCVCVSAARMWAGMSSGPSTVCRYSRLSSGATRLEESFEIADHVGIGILLNHQRRRSVLDKHGQQAGLHAGVRGNPAGHLVA